MTLRDQLEAALHKALLGKGIVPPSDVDAPDDGDEDSVPAAVNGVQDGSLAPVYLSNSDGDAGMAAGTASVDGSGGQDAGAAPLAQLPPGSLSLPPYAYGGAQDPGFGFPSDPSGRAFRLADILQSLPVPDRAGAFSPDDGAAGDGWQDSRPGDSSDDGDWQDNDSDDDEWDDEDRDSSQDGSYDADPPMLAAAPGSPHVTPGQATAPGNPAPSPAENQPADDAGPKAAPHLELKLSKGEQPFPNQYKYDEYFSKAVMDPKGAITPLLLKSLAARESSLNPNQRRYSRIDGWHVGLMQVGEAEAAKAKLTVNEKQDDRLDPESNIRAGYETLKDKQDKIEGFLARHGIRDQYTPQQKMALWVSAYLHGQKGTERAMLAAMKRGVAAPKLEDIKGINPGYARTIMQRAGIQ